VVTYLNFLFSKLNGVFAMDIGKRLKRLRLASSMTIEELANRAGLTKGFISQIERDKTSISLDNLELILKALGETVQSFFAELPVEKVVFGPKDWVVINEGKVGRYDVVIPRGVGSLLAAYIITLKTGERTETEEPYSGELFGYMLKGAMNLRLGQRNYKVKKGSCLFFEPKQEFFFKNEDRAPAKVLLVAMPPNL